MQILNIFTSFSPKIFLTIFLVKSKLSTAKKVQHRSIFTSFSPKTIWQFFSGNQSWIFRQKMKISNSVKYANTYLKLCLAFFFALKILSNFVWTKFNFWVQLFFIRQHKSNITRNYKPKRDKCLQFLFSLLKCKQSETFKLRKWQRKLWNQQFQFLILCTVDLQCGG